MPINVCISKFVEKKKRFNNLQKNFYIFGAVISTQHSHGEGFGILLDIRDAAFDKYTALVNSKRQIKTDKFISQI